MAQKQAFLKGTAILATANVLVKLIGALYTIPLARMISADGMGLYSSAYQIYLWLFIISTTGIPIAISKIVSEEMALGRAYEAHRIFKISLALLIILGLMLSFTLFVSAGWLVNAIGTSKAYFSLIAISPCLFFTAVMSAYRGYFQGMQNMVPTAVSELIEAVIKAILGLTLAYQFLGFGLEYSSAGAVLGVSLGGLIGMLSLIIIYGFYRRKIFYQIKTSYSSKKVQSVYKIIVKLVKISLPITLGASVFAVSSIIDLSMIMRRLKEIGFSEEHAIKLYGYLTGYAYKIYSLPTTIIIALAISIVPIIAASYINNNIIVVKKITNASLRIALLLSIPSAVGVGVLAGPILKLLFNDSNASQLLMILTISIIFVSTVQITGAILQGVGRVLIPVKNLLIGAILKVFLNYILVGIPAINILGAPISTGACYIVVTILNFSSIKKYLGVNYNIWELFKKPVLAAGMMGIIVFYLYNYTFLLWGRNSISTLLSVLMGMLIYTILIIIIGGIKKEELQIMPFGEKILHYLFK